MSTIYHLPSPLGIIRLEFNESLSALKYLGFIEKEEALSGLSNAPKVVIETARQMTAYFSGELQAFDLPLELEGTDFQKRVWEALLSIPYGRTFSYKDLSLQLGDAKLTRAVGAANGQNKIAIIIPCHRVIGADGSLTGYASGIERKKFLLDLESGSRQLSLF